jgi:hypothetical protein
MRKTNLTKETGRNGLFKVVQQHKEWTLKVPTETTFYLLFCVKV